MRGSTALNETNRQDSGAAYFRCRLEDMLMATISIGRFTLTSAWTERERKVGPSLVQRLRAWMLHRRTRAELRDADARTCQDIGITSAASADLVRTFGVDPTPLWGIGKVPIPRPENNRLSHRH